MAVIKLSIDNQNTFPHYMALSGDVKPNEGTRIGEYLQETDTRTVFQWDGADWNVTEVVATVLRSDYEYRILELVEETNRLLRELLEE